ncbi:MAG: histidine triad nucleotide-binding protein [Gemmatimonas sp.]
MTDSCLFCRIVRGELPVALIAQNELAVAFRDINPQAPVHVLVIPKRHVASLAEASDGMELGAISLLAAQVARDEGIADAGYRTVMNTGDDGGQTVHHLHLHLLGGRRLKWPPG